MKTPGFDFRRTSVEWHLCLVNAQRRANNTDSVDPALDRAFDRSDLRDRAATRWRRRAFQMARTTWQ